MKGTTTMPQVQMQASLSKEDAAKQRLAAHRDTMVGLWGENFEQHPKYADAVQQVARGRHAAFVLDDYRGF